MTAGPIYGRKTFPTAGEAAAREGSTLEAFRLSREHFGGFGKLVTEAREMLPAAERARASGLPAVLNVMIEGLPAPQIKLEAA